jgi:phage recombination protein Bet
MSTTTPEVIDEKKELIKRTFCKGSTDDELELFLHVCKHTGLDPMTRQIYAVKRKDTMTIQVGIDGLRSIAERTGNYSPGKEPSYQYNKEGGILCSTAYVKKRTPDGVWHEVSATAFFNEYKPSYGGAFWTDKPHLMIAKCAEALAIRKAFPAVTANLYSTEEMDRAEPVVDTVAFKQSKKISSVKEAIQEPQVYGKDFEELKNRLKEEGISSERLEEWVSLRCAAKGEPSEMIVTACLREEILPKFKKSFSQWLEQQAIAV